MNVFVVDASLVIKWLVSEIRSEAARQWLGASPDYVAPDLLFSEAGNAVWKKVRRRELNEHEGRQLVRDLTHVAVETVAPYAIRFEGRVILAYCAWDGRELLVLEPPGHRGFARLKARSTHALEDLVVGQVVALSWFPL